MMIKGIKVTWGGAHRELWRMYRTLGLRKMLRVFYWLWKTRRMLWVCARSPITMAAYEKFIAAVVVNEG